MFVVCCVGSDEVLYFFLLRWFVFIVCFCWFVCFVWEVFLMYVGFWNV